MQSLISVHLLEADRVAAHKGGEVSEDRQGRIGDANVRQGQEGDAGKKSVNWNTSLVNPLEDLGCLSLNSKLEQGSGTNVDI